MGLWEAEQVSPSQGRLSLPFEPVGQSSIQETPQVAVHTNAFLGPHDIQFGSAVGEQVPQNRGGLVGELPCEQGAIRDQEPIGPGTVLLARSLGDTVRSDKHVPHEPAGHALLLWFSLVYVPVPSLRVASDPSHGLEALLPLPPRLHCRR